jgi:predicted signal transduction protein with EAL and GGDEF domain
VSKTKRSIQKITKKVGFHLVQDIERDVKEIDIFPTQCGLRVALQDFGTRLVRFSHLSISPAVDVNRCDQYQGPPSQKLQTAEEH